MTTPLDLVVAKLHERGCKPKRSATRTDQYTAKCPNPGGHQRGDKRPSLSVGVGVDGRALVHCETGCDPDDVVRALGLSILDLFPDKEDDGPVRARVAATYDYHDAEGTLVFQVVRMDPKGFRQRRLLPSGEWAWDLRGIDERPLYRLPHVLDAVRRGEPIWVVEGEKDVEALVAAGHAATCNPAGAGKWRPEHTAALHGARLVEIVADDDTAGHDHARAVAAALVPVVDEVRLWLPRAGCKDVAEHLGQGRALAELRPMCDVGDDAPGDELEVAPSRLRANLLVGDEILKLPPVQWLIDRVLQDDGLAVVYGPPKSYKTFVVVDMALHIANGRPWRGLDVRRTHVLYIVAEGAPGVGPRAKAWCRRNGGTLDDMVWLTVAPDLFNGRGDVAEIIDIANEHGVGLVVIDTLARSMPGGEENSAKDMGIVIGHLDRIKEEVRCAVLLVHHTGKDAARGMRGSNALHGAVDTSLEIAGDSVAVNARVVDQKNAEADSAWWWKPSKEAPSVVLEPTNGSGSSGEVRDINVLRQLQLMDDGHGVSTSVWEDAVMEREICGKTTFHERKKALQDAGLVQKVGGGKRSNWALSAAGHAFLADAVTQ